MRRFFNLVFGRKAKSAPQRKPKAVRRRAPLAVEPLEERLVMWATYYPGNPEAVWSFGGAVQPYTNLSYSYSNLLDGGLRGLSAADLRTAVQEAMGLWAAVIPMAFFELPDSGPAPADDDYDPDGHPFLRWGHHGGMAVGTLAHAREPGDDGIHGDVHFNNQITFDFDRFLETAIHEFGHAIGMAHTRGDVGPAGCPAFLPAIMDACEGSYNFDGPGTAFLFQDDIDGIRSLYGAGLGYVLASGGDLHVYGTGGDNLITVNTSGGNITVFSAGNGSFTRSLAGIASIHIHGQGGNDIIRVESNAGRPTFLHGDDGNDIFDFGFVNRNLGLITGETRVFGDAGNDRVFVYDNANPFGTTYWINSFLVDRSGFGGIVLHQDDVSEITLWAGQGMDTVNVPTTRVGTPVFINNAGGRDTVNIGHADIGVQDIRAEVQVQNDPSFTTLNINDGGNADTARVAAFDINGRFGYLAGLAPAIISWDTADIAAINLTTGRLADDIYVLRNSEELNLNSTGGEDHVFLGTNERSTWDITGTVTIRNSPFFTRILVNDSADTDFRGVTLDSVLEADGRYGEIRSLARAPIRYKYADTRSLTVLTGRGGASIDVRATGVPTTLTGNGPSTTVNVGGSGGLGRIQGALTINNPPSHTGIAVYGFSEPQVRTYTLDTVQVDGTAHGRLRVSDVAAPILFKYANTQSVSLFTNSVGANVNVLATGVLTALATSGNNTNVNVGNAGRLQDITGPLRVLGAAALTVDDSNNPVGRPDVQLTNRQLTGLAATIEYGTGLRSLTVRGGAGADTVNVRSTPAGTRLTVDGGAGDDVLVGGPGRDLLIGGLGADTLDGGSGEDILVNGTTAYDANATALAALMAEWTRTDLPYAARVDHLLRGGGLNGSTLLNLATFTSDGLANTLTGAAERDLFYGSRTRDTHDWDRTLGEIFVDPDGIQGSTHQVSWYAGENNADDSVGSNHGTLVNGVAFAPGRVGQAFQFDGVDDYVRVTNARSLEPAMVSVEAWVNSTSTGRNRYVLAKGASADTAASYALYTGGSGGLSFYVFDGSTYVESPDAGRAIWDGNWHHVVGTYDGSSVWLYVDGAEVGAGTPTTIPIGYNLPTSNDLFLGTYNDNTSTNYLFSGRIDEVSVFSGALSAAEVRARFTSAPGVGPAAGLVSRYDAEGNANDAVGGNHGTLQGDVTFVPGRVGRAFDFDGTADYVDLGNDTGDEGMPGEDVPEPEFLDEVFGSAAEEEEPFGEDVLEFDLDPAEWLNV